MYNLAWLSSVSHSRYMQENHNVLVLNESDGANVAVSCAVLPHIASDVRASSTCGIQPTSSRIAHRLSED
jgi:hypothetical protein